jgi:dihydropyrimidinase
MSALDLTGGTVVTADGSFQADIAIRDGKIAQVGGTLPEGGERVDASGKLLMPGFIDGHTHMDMPFGGTITADDWDTGTAAALAGGTTMLVDFCIQGVGQSLAEALAEWHRKADDKARCDFGFHVAIADLNEDIKQELHTLPGHGVATVKLFMAYKGTSLFCSDEDLFEVLSSPATRA